MAALATKCLAQALTGPQQMRLLLEKVSCVSSYDVAAHTPSRMLGMQRNWLRVVDTAEVGCKNTWHRKHVVCRRQIRNRH